MKEKIGGDRLLSIEDVAACVGCCRDVASAIIDETGKPVLLHRRKLVHESDLLSYLRRLAEDGDR